MTDTKEKIRIPAAEWANEPIYAEGFGEGYFADVDALAEYCEDNERELPAEVVPCERRRVRIDVDSVLDNAVDDHYEDAYGDLVAVDELTAAIEAWNSKQTAASLDPMYGRVVVLTDAPAEATP